MKKRACSRFSSPVLANSRLLLCLGDGQGLGDAAGRRRGRGGVLDDARGRRLECGRRVEARGAGAPGDGDVHGVETFRS